MTIDSRFLSPVEIKKVVYNAYGLAHYENLTLFVEAALPGDVLTVKPLYNKKKSIFCVIDQILTPSPLRKSIRCPLSTNCGACDWVNVDYPEQLNLKTSILCEIFQNPDINITPSPVIDYYRNKCFFPVQKIQNNIEIGMFARNSHEIIPHKHCFLYPTIYKDILNHIKEWMIASKTKPYSEVDYSGNIRHIGIRSSRDLSQIIVIIVTKNNTLPHKEALISSLNTHFPSIQGIIQNIQHLPNNTITSDHSITLYGKPYLHDTLNNISLRIHYNAFYQINSPQAEIIYNDILTYLAPDDIVLDAYSGIGTIAFCIYKKVKNVYCIESSLAGHSANVQNQQLLKTKNIHAIHQKTENSIDKTIADHNINTIIFDPPRKGLETSTIATLTTLKIPKIIYLSCDPTTQKRDLQALTNIGYKITNHKAYDMFPHTFHIESLAILTPHS